MDLQSASWQQEEYTHLLTQIFFSISYTNNTNLQKQLRWFIYRYTNTHFKGTIQNQKAEWSMRSLLFAISFPFILLQWQWPFKYNVLNKNSMFSYVMKSQTNKNQWFNENYCSNVKNKQHWLPKLSALLHWIHCKMEGSHTMSPLARLLI